jgi:hypothetical protein
MRGFGKGANPYYTHGVVVTTYPTRTHEVGSAFTSAAEGASRPRDRGCTSASGQVPI